MWWVRKSWLKCKLNCLSMKISKLEQEKQEKRQLQILPFITGRSAPMSPGLHFASKILRPPLRIGVPSQASNQSDKCFAKPTPRPPINMRNEADNCRPDGADECRADWGWQKQRQSNTWLQHPRIGRRGLAKPQSRPKPSHYSLSPMER